MNVLAYITICTFWGLSSIATKIGLGGMDPFTFSFIRFLISGVILLIINWAKGKSIRINHQDLKVIVISAFMMYFMNSVFIMFATKRLDAGIVPILFSLVPVVMVIIETLIQRRMLVGIPGILGIIGGITGIGVVSLGAGTSTSVDILGLVLMLCAVSSWSSGSLYLKNKSINTSITVLLMYQTIVPMLTFLGIIIVKGGMIFTQPLGPAIGGVLYMALIDTLIGSACYVYLLKNWKVSIVATYAYINPIVGLIASYFILGESITFQKVVGMGIILFSVYLIQSDNRLRQKMAIAFKSKRVNRM